MTTRLILCTGRWLGLEFCALAGIVLAIACTVVATAICCFGTVPLVLSSLIGFVGAYVLLLQCGLCVPTFCRQLREDFEAERTRMMTRTLARTETDSSSESSDPTDANGEFAPYLSVEDSCHCTGEESCHCDRDFWD
jgi:hypothetical protein